MAVEQENKEAQTEDIPEYIPATQEYWDGLNTTMKLVEIRDAIGQLDRGLLSGLLNEIEYQLSKFTDIVDALGAYQPLTSDEEDARFIEEAGGQLLINLMEIEVKFRTLLGPEPWRALEMPNPKAFG